MALDTLGLIINFLGALALAIGTSIHTHISMSHLKLTLNYPGSPNGMVENAVQKNIKHIKNITIANRIVLFGYILFVIGFALQIYPIVFRPHHYCH